MPYLQSPFHIMQQASLFPFYRCLNWGMERFVHVLNVAYRVSSGMGLAPQFPDPILSCFCVSPVIPHSVQWWWQGLMGKWHGSSVPSRYFLRSESAREATHSKAVPQGYVPSPRIHIGCQGTKEVTQEKDFYNIWIDLLKDPETLSGCTGLAGS